MEWMETERVTRGFCLSSVRFAAGDGKKARRQAQTMNRFYEALENAAQAHADACQAVSPLYRYMCRITACMEGEEICVTVTLTLRIPGNVSRRKCILHRWRDGILQKEKIV